MRLLSLLALFLLLGVACAGPQLATSYSYRARSRESSKGQTLTFVLSVSSDKENQRRLENSTYLDQTLVDLFRYDLLHEYRIHLDPETGDPVCDALPLHSSWINEFEFLEFAENKGDCEDVPGTLWQHDLPSINLTSKMCIKDNIPLSYDLILKSPVEPTVIHYDFLQWIPARPGKKTFVVPSICVPTSTDK